MAAGLILLPILTLLIESFTSARLGLVVGFTLNNYYAAYSDPRFVPTLINSLVFAGGSTTLGLLTAVAIAWIVTRTNTPLGAFSEFIPVLPLLMPPMMDNIAWIFLLAPRAGILNSFLSEAFGISGVFNSFSMAGMVWVYGLSLVPLMYLMVLPAFLRIDPSLEEAAHLSGAGALGTFWTVTLPLALPAILSAAVVGFLHGLRSFETPILQGIPGGITVFVSLIYEATELEFNYGLAVAYSTTLLAVTIVLVLFYVKSTRSAEKYAAITGRAGNPRPFDIGKWRFVTLALLILYMIIAIFLPMVVVFVTSLIPSFNYDSFIGFSRNLTIENYAAVLKQPAFTAGLVNSFYISILAASVVLLVGSILSYAALRAQTTLRGIVEGFSTAPLSFPGLVLSLGLLLTYVSTPLYDTALVILLAFVVLYIPYGVRFTSGALVRISKDMDEAAFIHGAAWATVFRRIVLPLLKPALIAGFFYVFLAAYRDVGAAVLLTGPGLSYGAVTIFEYYTLGEWGMVASGSIIYAVILLALIIVAKYAFKVKFQ